jgi:hypothetical protein
MQRVGVREEPNMTTATFDDAVSELGAFVRVVSSPVELFNYVRRSMKTNPGKAVLASVALGILLAAKYARYRSRHDAERLRHTGASRLTQP